MFMFVQVNGWMPLSKTTNTFTFEIVLGEGFFDVGFDPETRRPWTLSPIFDRIKSFLSKEGAGISTTITVEFSLLPKLKIHL